jgi:nucleotide-binding universal stress UspA family protein
MKRILVVSDFSPTANAALPYAYSLVEPGGEVHLVHVIEHELQPNPMYAHYTPDSLALPQERAKVAAEVERQLLSLVPKGAKHKSVTTVAACVFHRYVAEGLIDEARQRQVNAVVIGSHGRTGLSHLLMGSVAEQVLRGCGLPVFIIPRKD